MRRTVQMAKAGIPIATKFSKHNGFRKDWKPGPLLYERPVVEAVKVFFEQNAKAAYAVLGAKSRAKELINRVFARAKHVQRQAELLSPDAQRFTHSPGSEHRPAGEEHRPDGA